MTLETFKEGDTFTREAKLKMARGLSPMAESDMLLALVAFLSDRDEEIKHEAIDTIKREWGRLSRHLSFLSMGELITLEKALSNDPQKALEVREVKIAKLKRGGSITKEFFDEKVILDEEKRGDLYQKILKMAVVEKIKLALFGNKEVRSILIRDPNRVVATAVLQNPRLTEDEVVRIAQSRNVCDEILRIIASSREWTKNYQVKLALVNNPKTPLSISLKLLPQLHEKDLRHIARSKNVPTALSMAARRMIDDRERR